MKFELTILGSSSATPVRDRFPSGQVLNINEKLYLIDCGEGTQMQLIRYGLKATRIDHIFISHLHGDHYLGLPGLLSSLHLNGRTRPLHVYGPEKLQDLIKINLDYSETTLRYPLEFHPVNPVESEKIYENRYLTVETIILIHRVPCTGYLFREKPHLRRIRREKLEQYRIPTDQIDGIKKGAGFTLQNGQVIPHEELTMEPRPSRAYAYCSDTLMKPGLAEELKEVDLLYHEATFMHDMLSRAQETFHTTARQAGEIASRARAKKLIIGHFSARYRELKPLLKESRQVFPDTELATEGKRFEIV